MQTTVILIELLIIGGEFVLILMGVYRFLFGVRLSNILLMSETPVLIAVAVALYPLGIIWSRFCDIALSRIDRKLKLGEFTSDLEYHTKLITVIQNSVSVAEGLAQVRSQYRIARATGISALFGAVLLLFAADIPLTPSIRIFSAFLLASAGLLSLQSWLHLRRHYLRYVKHASNISTAP